MIVLDYSEIERAEARCAYYSLVAFSFPAGEATGGARRGSSSKEIEGEAARKEKVHKETRSEKDGKKAHGQEEDGQAQSQKEGHEEKGRQAQSKTQKKIQEVQSQEKGRARRVGCRPGEKAGGSGPSAFTAAVGGFGDRRTARIARTRGAGGFSGAHGTTRHGWAGGAPRAWGRRWFGGWLGLEPLLEPGKSGTPDPVCDRARRAYSTTTTRMRLVLPACCVWPDVATTTSPAWSQPSSFALRTANCTLS